MGDPPLSRGSTRKMLSDVIPCEAKVAFMQKGGGRVPSLPKRGGVVQNIFWKRGGGHPLLFFWRGGSPVVLRGEGHPFS